MAEFVQQHVEQQRVELGRIHGPLCITSGSRAGREALAAGVAPQVVLEATHERALEVVSLADLKAHAWAH